MEARNTKISGLLLLAVTAAFPLLFVACGTTSNSSSGNPGAQNGNLNIVMQDASTEDWATIGVKVLSISLTPQGGRSPVTVFTASTPAPMINLVQLDQLGEILGNVQVPAGTYTDATLTIAANPGDVQLTVSADPETGFAGTPGATIPSNQIQIKGTQGSAGSLTVPVNVKFDSPLVVTANQSNALISSSTSRIRRLSWHTCRWVPARRCGQSTSEARCGIARFVTSRGWCCGTCTGPLARYPATTLRS